MTQEIPCTDQRVEERYLGAALMMPEVLDKHAVWPSEVTSPRVRKCLEKIQAMRLRRGEVGVGPLAIELEKDGDLVSVGGHEWLIGITGAIEAFPGALAARIHDLAIRRKARAHALRAVALAESGNVSESIRELRNGGELRTPDAQVAERFGTLKDAMGLALEEMSDRFKRGRPAYVKTGINALDEAIGGVEYGDLTVIGGDTSVGKSTTAMIMAVEQARAGHRPGVISFEDPAQRVGRRALSMLSGVPVVALRKGTITKWQAEAIAGGIAKANGLEIHLAYCIGEDIDAMESAVRVLVRERGCDVVYLDYVQAVEVGAKQISGDNTKREQMRVVLSRFKRELNRADPPATGVVLSQMKRRQNMTERPERSDLYEAGYIEQKADTIILLWKDGQGVVRGVLDKAKDDATNVEFAFIRDKNGMAKEIGA